LFGHDTPVGQQKPFEQSNLAARNIKGAIGADNHAGGLVKMKIAYRPLQFWFFGDAARQGPDARSELVHLERFGQIIIGPGIKACDLVFCLGLRGEQQNGPLVLAFPHTSQNCQPVHVWQIDVQHDDIDIFTAQHRVGLRPVVKHVDRMASIAQIIADAFGDCDIVFNNKDPHGLPLPKTSDARFTQG